MDPERLFSFQRFKAIWCGTFFIFQGNLFLFLRLKYIHSFSIPHKKSWVRLFTISCVARVLWGRSSGRSDHSLSLGSSAHITEVTLALHPTPFTLHADGKKKEALMFSPYIYHSQQMSLLHLLCYAASLFYHMFKTDWVCHFLIIWNCDWPQQLTNSQLISSFFFWKSKFHNKLSAMKTFFNSWLMLRV